jgi:hypothetical protein
MECALMIGHCRKTPRLLRSLLPLLLVVGFAPAVFAAAADHLIVGEFMVKTRVPYATFGSPFIEITNPTADGIDMGNVYLTDATMLPSLLYTNITLNDPATANPGGGTGGDFHAQFPAGYVLPAGASLAVALSGSQQYFAAYGRHPDFELYEDGGVPDAVPELVAAFPGAIAAGLGGGSNVPALSDVAESIVLYGWNGASDLVQDIDYVMWGTNSAVRVDKTDVTVLGSTYLNDTAVVSQSPVAAAGPTFGHAFRRISADEGAETLTGGNGLAGHNETSENLASTWSDITGFSPPPAPETFFPSAPIFTAAAQDPALPYAGLAATLSATVRSFTPLTDVTFYYNVDGGAYAGLSGVDGGSGLWTATVPGQVGGAVVTWYCTATNSAGGSAASPVAAPRYTRGWTVAAAPPPAALRKAPYLVFLGDPTTMQVLWQVATTRPCTIEWGTDTNYALGALQTAEYGTDHQHAYTLTGLEPDRQYFYRVTFDGTLYPGSFHTAPPLGSPQFKFIAYGDTRTNASVHNTMAGQMVHAVAVDPERQSVLIAVGDMVTDGDNEAIWDSEFFPAAYANIRQMLAELPFQSCMGNHEGTGTVFTKYFPYPFAAARYWSFDYGPAHFVVVDQYAGYAPGSAQYTWIQNDLATTTQPWRFVVLHEPGWTAGGSHPNNAAVQQYLQPLFVQYGVSLVFGGHNHYYARAVVDGVQHLTIGGGGAPLYTPVPDSPNVVASARSYHYCRITIDGGHLGFAAVNGAAVLDTFVLVRPTAVDESALPASPVLHAVQPNPFNPRTTIRFDLPTAGPVRLAVYDVAGRRIRALVDSDLQPGPHQAVWDGRDSAGRAMASGSYFARLEAGGTVRTVGMGLIR